MVLTVSCYKVDEETGRKDEEKVCLSRAYCVFAHEALLKSVILQTGKLLT